MTEFGARLLFAAGQGFIALALVSAISFAFRKLPPVAKAWLWRMAFLRFLIALVADWSAPILPPVSASAPISSATSITYAMSPPATAVIADPLPIWLYLWAIPATILLTLGIIRFAAIVRLARTADDVTPGIRASEEIQVPCLVGIWRGLILLPSALLHPARADECALAIAHETAHRDRRDPLYGLLNFLAACLFWFVLPVWFALREYAVQVEMDCDQRALRSTRLSPRQYGGMLVALATQNSLPVGALSMAGSPSGLKRRLTAMKNPIHKPKFASLALVGLLGAFLAVPVRPVAAAPVQTSLQRKVDEILATVPKTNVVARKKLQSLRSELGRIKRTNRRTNTMVYVTSASAPKGMTFKSVKGGSIMILDSAGKAEKADSTYTITTSDAVSTSPQKGKTITLNGDVVTAGTTADPSLTTYGEVTTNSVSSTSTSAGTTITANPVIVTNADGSKTATVNVTSSDKNPINATATFDATTGEVKVSASPKPADVTFRVSPASKGKIVKTIATNQYIILSDSNKKSRTYKVKIGQKKVSADGTTIIVTSGKDKKGEVTVTVVGGK